MTNRGNSSSSSSSNNTFPQVRPAPLMTGGGLIVAGGLLVLAGVLVGGIHVIMATRQWISEMDVPPSEAARLKLAQAKAAAAAGASAWQDGTTTAARSR
ncbi:MAG TPA: hypothetical protein VMC03_16135 [Streptosporangiaceae bacterium]|nr:hypothetical protein [Streptosporangiaceae bacterium]